MKNITRFPFFSSLVERKEPKEARPPGKASILDHLSVLREMQNSQVSAHASMGLKQAAFLIRKTLGPEGLFKGGIQSKVFHVNYRP